MSSLGIKSLLAVAVLLTTVCSQQYPINTITAAQPFNFYCNASTIQDSGVIVITTLTISRNVSLGFDLIATYISATFAGIAPNYTNIPQGRTWNFTFSGANGGVNNKNTMNIVWSVLDTKCEDAGIYSCKVDYYAGIFPKVSEKFLNVTAIPGASDIDMTIYPDTNNRQYKEGDNVTFTCKLRGPNTLKFRWQLWTTTVQGYEQQSQLPDKAVITENPTGSPSGTGGCAVYNLQSTLSVNLTLTVYPETETNIKTYKCIVFNPTTNNEVESANITIGTGGTTEGPGQPQPQVNNSSTGPDVGMIVGIIIGCVALIAIIIIIIFVVRYRKRSKERNSNYKDNEDRADAAPDNNLHAPPPVFYPPSKPSKGSKDEKIPTGMTNEALDNSYDSRDSGTKGPPRYINAEADAQGPPRYEKESHRGRSNRGYDEEERERNGGHGRSHKQPRGEHEERKHRSRGHDDDSHPRRYNADDGNVGHVQYGDPDMGTSI